MRQGVTAKIRSAPKDISRKMSRDATNYRIAAHVAATDILRSPVMRFGKVWRALQRHWQTVTDEFWPDSPQDQTRAEIARLDKELATLHGRMVRLRTRIEQVSGRRCVARLESRYERHREELERRKRLRRDLVLGRLQVVKVSFPEGA